MALQPRVKLRSLFWSKSPRRRDTVWDVVADGDLPMDVSHLAALEALFAATSAGPVARSSSTGTSVPVSPWCNCSCPCLLTDYAAEFPLLHPNTMP